MPTQSCTGAAAQPHKAAQVPWNTSHSEHGYPYKHTPAYTRALGRTCLHALSCKRQATQLLVLVRLQGNNELWLALVLTHRAVFGLSGPELAGLLGAILTGEVLKRPSVNWVAYPASPRVCGMGCLEGAQGCVRTCMCVRVCRVPGREKGGLWGQGGVRVCVCVL